MRKRYFVRNESYFLRIEQKIRASRGGLVRIRQEGKGNEAPLP